MATKIQLKNQEVEVVNCQDKDCGALMVNLDANQLAPGDLLILKKNNLRISNPETDKPICLKCEYKTLGKRLSDWLDEEVEDDDNDDSFFSGGTFLGSISSGSSSGGSSFGGFGGGGFGGGGASGSF